MPLCRRTPQRQRSVAAAVADYIEETKLTKKPKTLAAYTTALNYFMESCHKLNLEDIDRKDLLKFCVFLRDEKEQAPRSVYNKFENLMAFLKANGIRGLVGKNDWPRYTEEEPEMYEKEELGKLFAACDAEERLWYEFFLMTGMREQEVMYTYWSDVNFAASTVRVSHKPDRGWTPKAYKEREIPIPAKLAKKPEGVEGQSGQELVVWSSPPPDAIRSWIFSMVSKLSPNVRSSTPRISGCTSSVRHSQRDAFGPGSICEPCSSGWVTPTWRAPCAT